MSARAILENRGTHNGMAKLTDEQVHEMRAERAAGATYAALAAVYGVCASNVHQICSGRTWQHLSARPEPQPDRGGRRHGEPGNKGTVNGQSKLTDAEVWDIRSRRERGHTYEAIAARFGVSYNTVWKICNGQAWVHLRERPAAAASPLESGPRLYWHRQPNAARVWTVIHWLFAFPSVLVIDSARRLVYPEDVEHLDMVALVVRFSAPLGGEVQCRV